LQKLNYTEYLYCIEVGDPLTGLIPPHFYACTKPGPGFPTSNVVVFLCPMIVSIINKYDNQASTPYQLHYIEF
jgi:hypothetical protein